MSAIGPKDDGELRYCIITLMIFDFPVLFVSFIIGKPKIVAFADGKATTFPISSPQEIPDKQSIFFPSHTDRLNLVHPECELEIIALTTHYSSKSSYIYS